jgi:hypothetical protein
MTDDPLLACPACARHVRASEISCPFCAAALADAGAAAIALPGRRALGVRLSRAALFALGALGAGAAACSTQRAAYGGPPVDRTVDAAAADAGFAESVSAPVYGGPPMMEDAAPPTPTPTPATSAKGAGTGGNPTKKPSPTK